MNVFPPVRPHRLIAEVVDPRKNVVGKMLDKKTGSRLPGFAAQKRCERMAVYFGWKVCAAQFEERGRQINAQDKLIERRPWLSQRRITDEQRNANRLFISQPPLDAQAM